MSEELEVAIKAAKEAGKILKNNFGKTSRYTVKGNKTLVSEIDNQAEKAAVSVIREKFPDHSVVAEEGSNHHTKSDYKWFVDPLDGTGNYLSHIPIFATVISLFFRKKPLLGVTLLPATEELFSAQKDKGSFLNGAKLSVKSDKPLELSAIHFSRSSGEFTQEFLKAFNKILPRVRTPRIYASIASSLAYVASSGVDASVVLGANPWDHLAGALLVEEAGGKVTDLEGSSWNLESTQILATNGKIHEELLAILNH
jgi:myo-inositol-1(or 4)-monophosphatase